MPNYHFQLHRETSFGWVSSIGASINYPRIRILKLTFHFGRQITAKYGTGLQRQSTKEVEIILFTVITVGYTSQKGFTKILKFFPRI